MQEIGRNALHIATKHRSALITGHHHLCVHTHMSRFCWPLICENCEGCSQTDEESLHLSLHMCHFKSLAFGTYARPVIRSNHKVSMKIHSQRMNTSLHNVRQHQYIQESQQRPCPTILRQEDSRICCKQRDSLALYFGEGPLVGWIQRAYGTASKEEPPQSLRKGTADIWKTSNYSVRSRGSAKLMTSYIHLLWSHRQPTYTLTLGDQKMFNHSTG